MKKSFIKALLLFWILLISTLPVNASVYDKETPDRTSFFVSPFFEDIIVTKYRFKNGKYQYRRWNETRGVWVDPYWIDVI